MSEETAESLVQKGATVLDEFFGPEWVEKIDTGILDQDSPWTCVIAQLDEDDIGWARLVDKVVEKAGALSSNPVDYGFEYHIGIEMDELNEAWKDLILERCEISPLQTKDESVFVLCVKDHEKHNRLCGPYFSASSVEKSPHGVYRVNDALGNTSQITELWMHELQGEYKLDLEFGDLLIFHNHSRMTVVSVRTEGPDVTVVDCLAKTGSYGTWGIERLETEVKKVLRHPRGCE